MERLVAQLAQVGELLLERYRVLLAHGAGIRSPPRSRARPRTPISQDPAHRRSPAEQQLREVSDLESGRPQADRPLLHAGRGDRRAARAALGARRRLRRGRDVGPARAMAPVAGRRRRRRSRGGRLHLDPVPLGGRRSGERLRAAVRGRRVRAGALPRGARAPRPPGRCRRRARPGERRAPRRLGPARAVVPSREPAPRQAPGDARQPPRARQSVQPVEPSQAARARPRRAQGEALVSVVDRGLRPPSVAAGARFTVRSTCDSRGRARGDPGGPEPASGRAGRG